MTTSTGPIVRRGFVDVTGGQIHYRHAGEKGQPPVVLIHASPGSGLSLEPLAAALSVDRYVVVPDTMGNGDSCGQMPEVPDIEFFAARALEAIDALGLDQFDLYGTHTGASIAAQIAIENPKRVRKLSLDGVGLYSDEMQTELLDRYAPAMKPDLHGSHINWAWHFVRDTYMFWPWYNTNAEHRRSLGLPAPEVLHGKVIDVLKAIETYHLSYRAAFRFDKRERFGEIRVPTMAACAASDMLAKWHDELAALIPGSVKTVIPSVTADPAGAAAVLREFFSH